MSLPRYALFLCLGLTGCTWSTPTTTREPAPPPPPPTRGTPEGRLIPVGELFEAYDKNAAAADKEYQGLILKVESTIKGVGMDGANPQVELYVPVTGGGVFLRCVFAPTDADEIKGLKPGGTITIRGRCAGIVNNGLTLDSCSVVRYGAPKSQ